MFAFFRKRASEADIEAIANRNLLEAFAALTLKQSAEQSAEFFGASRSIRALCDDALRKAGTAKKSTKHSRIMRVWRMMTGIDAMERELELERNRSLQNLRLVADKFKALGEIAIERKDFYGACLLKARDLQAAAKQLSGADHDMIIQAAISVTQMGTRFKEKQGTDSDATDSQK